jgi:acyl carrier protein
MPGTGHLDIARAAVEARPEPRALEIRDLAFLSPFVVTGESPRELRVHLGRNGSASQSLVIAGRSTGNEGAAGWQEHVTATVGYVDADEPRILDLAAIAARCTVREKKFSGSEQSPHMDFGPRWNNRQSIRYGNNEALAVLELPAQFAKDIQTYRLHPALMDMATACGWELIPGFDAANDFYVPLSYTRLRMFAPLPARIYSHVRLVPAEFDPKELVVFDVTITDEAGRELVDIEGFMMARVTDTSVLQGTDARFAKRRSHANFDPPAAPAQLPPLVKWMHGAITSSEGMAALERILAGPVLPQVFATPRPVSALIAELRQPQVHTPAPRVSVPVVPTAPLAEIEAVLATHESVRECVVLQRPNKPGELTLVGYVVFEQGRQATVSDLRRFLKARLPEHVVRTFVELDSLPRVADGTVDRGALPDPFGVADTYVAPRTETEAIIADIWKEVLGVERVSVHDNFFDAGGHSLLAVRVVVRIDKKIGVRLNQAVMVLQTLEQIAAECDKRRASAGEVSGNAAAGGEQSGIGKKIFNALWGEKS